MQAYYEIEFPELLSNLKRNKLKLACDPSRRGFGEDFRREYSASMEKLPPLLLRIEKINPLIDSIVYKLYGLSEVGRHLLLAPPQTAPPGAIARRAVGGRHRDGGK